MKLNRTLDRERLRWPDFARSISYRTMQETSRARWWAEWRVAVRLEPDPR